MSSCSLVKETEVEEPFGPIFELWPEIINNLEKQFVDRDEYLTYVKPVELQTIGECSYPRDKEYQSKGITLTVYISEGMLAELYQNKFTKAIIESVYEVMGFEVKEIIYTTHSEIEQYYKECDRGWNLDHERGDDID